jgi:O-antigen/teichoic acid export membrane protein
MKKKLLSVIFSNFMGAGLGFLLNIILARILDVESYGAISLIFSFVIVLYTLLDFGFNSTQVIFYNNYKNQYESNLLLGLIKTLYRKWFVLVSLFSLAIITLLSFLYNLSYLEMLCLFSSHIFYSLYRFDISTFQALGNWKKYNILNVLNNIVKLAAIMLCVGVVSLVDNSEKYYESVLIGYLLYSVVLYLISYFYQTEDKTLQASSKLNSQLTKSFFSTLVPLGASSAVVVIIMRVDVFIIEHYMTLADLAVYFAASSVALVFPIITGSLLNVFIQKAAQSDISYLRVLVKQQIKVALYLPLVFMVFTLLAPYLFTILFPAEYQNGTTIFTILLLAHIGGMAFSPIESYFYAHKPTVIFKLKLVQLVITVTLELLLVNTIGLNGIAAAILVSRLIGWCYISFLSYKELDNASKNKVSPR